MKRSGVEEGAGEPAETADVVQEEGGEYQRREDRVQKQYGEDGVALQGRLFRCIIESEKGRGYECEY